MPLWPCLANLNGDCIRLPLVLRFVFVANDSGSGWPLYFSSAGLGSKVSMCDGPPFMNKKISRLARGVKCGGLTESGFAEPAGNSIDGDALDDESAANKPASAKTELKAS